MKFKLGLFVFLSIVLLSFLISVTVPVHATTDLIDSYSTTNRDDNFQIYTPHPSSTYRQSAGGQSFNSSVLTSTVHKITSCAFFLAKLGSPGICNAVLYAHSGTYGTDSIPTGSALATSDDFNASTLPGGWSLATFTFSGAQQYQMAANTLYCIVLQTTSGTWDSSNCIYYGMDASSPTHAGNLFRYANSEWTGYAGWDSCFYVYGDTTASGWSKTFEGIPSTQISTIDGVPLSQIGSVDGVP